jgi:hypothetical protein
MDWDSFDKVEVVKTWVGDLSKALSAAPSPKHLSSIELVSGWPGVHTQTASAEGRSIQDGNPNDLDITGTKVIFDCPDAEKRLLLARRVAADIDAHFLDYGILQANKLDVAFLRIAEMMETASPKKRILFYAEAPGLLVRPKDHMFMTAEEKAILQEGGEGSAEIKSSVMQRYEQHVARLKQFVLMVHHKFVNNSVIFVVGTHSIEELFPALVGVDALNRVFRFPERSDEQIGNDFIDSFGKDYFDDSILKSPAKVGRMTRVHGWGKEDTMKRLRLHLLRKIRKANETKIGFEDLLDVELRDIVEFDEETLPAGKKEKTAYHEAGHVVAELVCSEYTKVPEYCAAKPGRGFGGIMIQSMENSTLQPESFSEFQAYVRTALGGRAAEELIYGASGVTTGPSADLFEATRFARRYIGRFGFGPDWELSQDGEKTTTGRNLAAWFTEGVNENGEIVEYKLFDCPNAEAGLYENVRRFLEQEYQATLDILKEHRPLLDAVAARLKWDVIDKTEFDEIIKIYRSQQATKLEQLKAWATCQK